MRNSCYTDKATFYRNLLLFWHSSHISMEAGLYEACWSSTEHDFQFILVNYIGLTGGDFMKGYMYITSYAIIKYNFPSKAA